MSESFANYFNYFTEIEEHFQKTRGTALFLLSPLDWALIETWKNSGVPLEAVLRGIDAAFEKWRARKSRVQMVNSLAFCAQAVMVEAQRLADTAVAKPAGASAASPFSEEELRKYLNSNATRVEAAGPAFASVAGLLREIESRLQEHAQDLEALEQRLTAIEKRMIATAQLQQSETDALASVEAVADYLRPYRGKMTAAQISMLETQYRESSVLEWLSLPRLSLFYLR